MNANLQPLIEVLRHTRQLLALPESDFVYSEWGDANEAMAAIDALIAELKEGRIPDQMALTLLFAPTGSIQEVSARSGWGREFLDVAARFDGAARSLYRPAK